MLPPLIIMLRGRGAVGEASPDRIEATPSSPPAASPSSLRPPPEAEEASDLATCAAGLRESCRRRGGGARVGVEVIDANVAGGGIGRWARMPLGWEKVPKPPRMPPRMQLRHRSLQIAAAVAAPAEAATVRG
jgi:hypothetical protein